MWFQFKVKIKFLISKISCYFVLFSNIESKPQLLFLVQTLPKKKQLKLKFDNFSSLYAKI